LEENGLKAATHQEDNEVMAEICRDSSLPGQVITISHPFPTHYSTLSKTQSLCQLMAKLMAADLSNHVQGGRCISEKFAFFGMLLGLRYVSIYMYIEIF
jgi:hypothetical protein